MCGVCVSGVMGVGVTAWLAGCPPAERLSDVDLCLPSDTELSEPPVEDVGSMRSVRCSGAGKSHVHISTSSTPKL